MHENIARIHDRRLPVLGGREACQTLVVDENSQGFEGRYERIDAQIKLVAIDQEWLIQVQLAN